MTSPVSEVTGKLKARASAFVKENRLPGAAVGIVHGDDLVWTAGIGFADVASRTAPDASTLYRIASITKTFTGTAIMQLRDEGKLHLDDPVVAHIPELHGAESSFGAIETVTIRRMLSHESGLMSEPPGADWTTSAYEGLVDRNLERVGEIGTRIPPNMQQKYSNLAYQMLGEVVARASGIPYVDHVRTAIWEPLDMTGTYFEPPPDEALPRRSTPYAARWLSDELDFAGTSPIGWAEGGAWSSVHDLAKWISFQLREDAGERDGAQVLAGSSLKQMHQARYLGDDAWTEAWCIAWYAMRKDDVIWVQHSGGLKGFTTNVCFDPKEKVGAIVLLNSIGDPGELAMELGGIARTAVREASPPIEPPAPMPEAYRSLLGVYTMQEWAALARIEWRDGKLTLVDPSDMTWLPTLSPTEYPDVFMIDPGGRQSGELARFERTADGRVRSLFFAAGTLARLDPVE